MLVKKLVGYIILVLILGTALLNTAHAEQKTIQTLSLMYGDEMGDEAFFGEE